MALRLPNEPREPGMGPLCACPAPAPAAIAAAAGLALSPAELQLVRDAMFDPVDAAEIAKADKVVIGGNWFCLLQDDLVGGPVNTDGTLDYGAACVIDMPETFEYPDLVCKATRMLRG